MKQLIAVLSTLFILVGCAQRGNPSGGEGDVTSPLFLKALPETETVKHSVSEPIVLRFNEWVDPKSAEKAVTVHPTVTGGFDIKTTARKVTIVPDESFAENTTYHVLINSELTDFYKNRLKEPVNLVFSTGDKIDSGVIAGTAVLENDDTEIPLKVALFRASRLDSTVDTTFLTEADYFTQCDSLGKFSFSNINENSYSLVAYRDKNGDNLLTPGEAAFITKEERISTDPDIEHILTRVATDTVKNTITKPLFITSKIMRGTVTPAAAIPDKITITRTDSTAKSYSPMKSTLLADSTTILIEFSDSVPSAQYDLFAEYQNRFTAGKHLPENDTLPYFPVETDTLRFNAITTGDTAMPVLSNFRVEGKEQLVPKIVLTWSAPVTHSGEIFLTDSSENQYEVSISERPEERIEITPVSELPRETELFLNIEFNQFTSLSGIKGDTIDTTFSFTTVGDKDLALSLLIENSNCDEYKDWQWEIHPVKTKKSYKMNKTENGYVAEMIPAGQYTISLFEDINKNGVQDLGRLFPRKSGENRIYLPDTVKAKGRWRTEIALESPCDLLRQETLVPEDSTEAQTETEAEDSTEAETKAEAENTTSESK